MTIPYPAFKRLIATILLGLCLLPLTGKAEQFHPEWEQFTDQFIKGYFAAHPNAAVNAGLHDFDGRIPDWSRASLSARMEQLKSQRKQAISFQRQALSERQYLEKMHVLSVIDSELFWVEKARWPYKNPYYYAEALDPNIYISRDYAPLEQRLRAYIAYATQIPAAVEQIRNNLQTPLAKPFINIGIAIVEGLAQYYATDVPAAFQPALRNAELRNEFEKANQQAKETLLQFAGWLKEQRSQASDAFAMGAADFNYMLSATERLSMQSGQIEQLVRRDLERNHKALEAVCLSYAPKQTLAQCIAKARKDKPGDVLEAARQQLVGLKKFVMEQQLVSIPEGTEPLVAESPPYRRWNPAYIDIPGPFEKNLPAIYYVSPPDMKWPASEREAFLPSRPELLFISLHEVWPGHFLHFLHANQNASKFARLFVSYGFAEGWAHYSEEMMWEAGFNEGDATTHIGQLLNALLRNVRCLAGFGLHTHGMSVDEAQKLFIEQAFLDKANARQQAERGTFDPEYVKYTLGKLMIRKLRDEWTVQQGGRKNWRAFHDQLLSYGGPPLPLVRTIMLRNPSGAPL